MGDHARGRALGGVSPELQQQEEQLLRDLRLVDLRLEKEDDRLLQFRDPDRIGKLLEERKGVEATLVKLIARMEKEFPQYADLKYPLPCTLDQARSCLDKDEVALLYLAGTEAS
jgi:hypothetical protein